jgi:hypothetical protein
MVIFQSKLLVYQAGLGSRNLQKSPARPHEGEDLPNTPCDDHQAPHITAQQQRWIWGQENGQQQHLAGYPRENIEKDLEKPWGNPRK